MAVNLAAAGTAAPARDGAWPNPVYAWYVVVVLMLAYTNSFIDRQILTLLIEPIRRDLQISDTQVSLLGGLAFSIFYTSLGIPLARLADQTNRRNLMIVGVGLWSVMTALCGITRSFWQLFFARVGVGVGEAALSPAAFSVLADYFPPNRLGRAVSAYSMGLYFGAGLALLVGGTVVSMVSSAPPQDLPIIGRIYPWQLTFLFVGALGLPILLIMLTIREPLRRGARSSGDSKHGASSLPALRQFVSTNRRTIVCHFAAFTLFGIGIASYLFWAPSFLMRTYGWQAPQAGWTFGSILFVCGSAGVFFGGWVADRLARAGRPDAILRAALYGICAAMPFVILTPLAHDPRLATAGLAGAVFFFAFPQGLPAAALQVISPNALRAQMVALYFFVGNLIANGLGPTFVALITDYGFGDPKMLRYAIVLINVVALPAAALTLILGLRSYRGSVERARFALA